MTDDILQTENNGISRPDDEKGESSPDGISPAEPEEISSSEEEEFLDDETAELPSEKELNGEIGEDSEEHEGEEISFSDNLTHEFDDSAEYGAEDADYGSQVEDDRPEFSEDHREYREDRHYHRVRREEYTAPMSAFSYIAHAVLYTIPGVGIIFMLVDIISGKNVNRQRFALIWLGVLIAAAAVLCIAAWAAGLAG